MASLQAFLAESSRCRLRGPACAVSIHVCVEYFFVLDGSLFVFRLVSLLSPHLSSNRCLRSAGVTSFGITGPSRGLLQLLSWRWQTTSPLPHRNRGRNIAPTATLRPPSHTALATKGDHCGLTARKARRLLNAPRPAIGHRQQPQMCLLRHDRSFGSAVDDFP